MKVALAVLLGLLLLAGVFLPAFYLRATADLPPIDTEYDIERGLRTAIEGERRALRKVMGVAPETLAWPRPSLALLPRELVLLFVSQSGCPNYFQTSRESHLAWTWRALNAHVLKRPLGGADDACDWRFAGHIAMQMRISNRLQRSIATHRIRAALQRDQLVAYDLMALPIEPGYFGVTDAAELLLHKKLEDLSLAALAELALAMPPNRFYEDVRSCQNPILLRKARDRMLSRMADAGILTPERAKQAQAQPLGCDQPF
ncbi:MAG: hypothetical protein ACKVPX_04865 [Myxococcaceae bacterium]